MIKIRESKDYNLTFKLAKDFNADAFAIDKITTSWIASENDKNIGIIGVCKWDKGYAIVDLFAAAPGSQKKEVMDKLVKILLKKAQNNKIEKIYCHMGKEKTAPFLNNGFIKIKDNQLPVDYFCSCTQCKDKGVTCFPNAFLWKN